MKLLIKNCNRKMLVGMLLLISISKAWASGQSITVVNNTGEAQRFYFDVKIASIPKDIVKAYNALEYPCRYPSGKYSPQGTQTTCHFDLPHKMSQAMPITGFGTGTLTIDISAGDFHIPQGPCNTTLAEFTLNGGGADSYDISLVNGRSFNMQIASSAGGQTIALNKGDDPKTTLGVYPVGCSKCVDNVGIAPAAPAVPGVSTTANCPGFGRPAGPMPTGSCKTGTEMDPKPNKCGIDSVPVGGDYTVTFNAM